MSAATRRWLGLDVGATKLLGVVVDDSLRVLARQVVPTRREAGPDAVIERCGELARGLIGELAPAAGTGHGGATDSEHVAGVGVGFAGLVDAAAGRVSSSIMLPGWDGLPLAERLAADLALPVRIDNDATAAGFGEYAALGEPAGMHLAVLTVGTGIGGALFIDGRLLRGASGFAGEFGNTTIDWQGEACWCGSRGCLNTLASGSAMTARARELARETPASLLAGREGLRLEDLAVAAAAGDALASRVIADGATALGAGLANLVNAISPHRIALCGGVLGLGAGYLEQVRASTRARSFAESWSAVEVDAARRGVDTGAIGAAVLARDAFGSGEAHLDVAPGEARI